MIDTEHFYGFGVPSPSFKKWMKEIIEQPKPVKYECTMKEYREDGSVIEMFTAACDADGLKVRNH